MAPYRPRAKSKYGNKRAEVDGISFQSRKEARRYSELKLLERAGEITELQLQPRYPIHVNGALVCTYIGDFSYVRRDGARITEDVKSPATKKKEVYRLKRKLVKALYGIDILET